MDNAGIVNFKVDRRLSSILMAEYPSCERALRELVDNAWDADAAHVGVTLPDFMSQEPIVVEDDGHGMVKKELEQEYLNIANSRKARKGERTPRFKRLVKGRRGIGKFAGLVIAETMEVRTWARGVETVLTVLKKDLQDGECDIERIPLHVSTGPCDSSKHGTRVTLSDLKPKFPYPDEDRLKEILAYDYGKEAEIEILVNGSKVCNFDIPGTKIVREIPLLNGGIGRLEYTVAVRPVSGRKAGIILREGNKAVGKPSFWGLENDESLPVNLRNRIVGELVVPPGSIETTANGVDFLEGDKGIVDISEKLRVEAKRGLKEVCSVEYRMAEARFQKLLKKRLETIPEFRRDIVKERLERLIQRSYQEGESEERIETLVNLVLDALEMDEYWHVCDVIEKTDKADVFRFSDALHEFGLADMAFMVKQANQRLKFLEGLSELAQNPATLEKQMHEAIERNLWIFGPMYSLMFSNQQLKTIVERFLGEHYVGEDADNRPDLLLSSSPDHRRLLIEFKRPSIHVGREAEAQAKKYADKLTGELNAPLDILVVGGRVDPSLREEYASRNLRFRSYSGVITDARDQLEWLIRELGAKGH
jgi:hypothetical protein